MNREPLHALLRKAWRKLLWVSIRRAGAIIVAALLTTGLLAVLWDAAFGLGAAGLVAIDIVLGLAVVLSVVWFVGQLWRVRYHPRRMARVIETRSDLSDNRLINALLLAETREAGSSPALRDYAVAQGTDAASAIDPSVVVDRRRLWQAFRLMLLTIVIVGVMYALMPGLFHAVLPRLISPYADHPAYTALSFDVQVQPEPVLFGRPASILVTVRGPRLPEQAAIVLADDVRQPQRQRLPMVRQAVATRATDAAPPDHALYQLKIDRAEKSRQFYVDTPGGRSKWYQLEVKPVPLFEQVDLRYDYPEYTTWSDGAQPLDARGIRALQGTQVTVTLQSNVPLGRGVLELDPPVDSASETEDEDAPAAGAEVEPVQVMLEPDSTDPRIARGTFTMQHDARFHLTLEGADGTPGLEPLHGAVVAIPDEKPSVRIEQPAPRIVVPEGWKVDGVVVVEDDIGVGRLVLQRGVNGWGPSPTELALSRTQPGHATGQFQFDLEGLGARAGDVITYFAVAYDNHPSPANTVESDIHAIEIISWEEYLEYARTRVSMEEIEAEFAELNERLESLRAEREALLEELEALKEKLASGEPLTEAEKARLEELEDELDEYAERAAQLAQDMRERADRPQLFDFEQAVSEALRHAAQGLDRQNEVARHTSQATRSLAGEKANPSAQQGFAEAVQMMRETTEPFGGRAQQEMEQTQEDLERVRLATEMVAAASLFRQVIEDQRELTERLAQFRRQEQLSPADQLRAAEMAQQQREIQQDMLEAIRQLDELSKQAEQSLPKMSASARAIVDKVNELEIAGDQSDAERLASAGQGRYAHRAAASASEKLDSLLGDCQSTGNHASDDLDGCLGLMRGGWKQAMAQLAGAGIPGIGKQGGQGGGYSGSMASMVMMGPFGAGDGDSEADRRLRGSGRGDRRSGRSADQELDPVEHLDPGGASRQRGGRAPIVGVPARYRDIAEAYFRRLADDQAR